MHRAVAVAALMGLYCVACATMEKAPTDARLVEAQKAFAEGQRLKESGQYKEAVPHFERALELREAVLGETHLDVANCLFMLGVIHHDLGDHERTEPLFQRALAIREAVLGNNHPDVAELLRNLAILYADQGNHARAESLHKRALAIAESTLGKNHPDVAKSLNNLACLYKEQGQHARAELLYNQALAIMESALGKNHLQVAFLLSNLALLHADQGQYTKADTLYERALTIAESALGDKHPNIANLLNNRALLYWHQEQHTRAQLLYERVLAIEELTLGKNHPSVAMTLSNIANLHEAQGDYAHAEQLYERALVTMETALGKNHPALVRGLNNLGNIYAIQGQHARAKPLHERALAITELAFGKKHPEVANSLNSLAITLKNQEQYEQASQLHERALAITEAAFGKSHPHFATSLHNLANVYFSQKQYERAEPLYEHAIALWESTLGKNHPQLTDSLHNLARLRFTQRRFGEAVRLLERAFIISEGHLRQEVFGFSEARLASVLHLLRAKEERIYALVSTHPNNARLRHLALTATLLRKGRSAEEIADTSRIIYRNLDEADRAIFERLRGVRTQFATLSLAGPGQLSPADYQQRLKELAEQGDALETDLARRSEPLRALHALPPAAELLNRVAATLPKNGVLVEFVTYSSNSLIPNASAPISQRPSEPHYLALLLFADGRTHALALGPAAPIDKAVQHLHEAFSGRDVSYQSAAQELYYRTFRHLVPHLGKVQRVFLAPDSQLALIPFAALHDGRRFLVDAWDITYLTSGKDLLRRLENNPTASSVVVLADPNFDSSPAMPDSSTRASLVERSASLERFFSTLRAEFANQPWPPLPGTQKEAKTIQRLFPQAQLLLGPAATKDALLKLETPGVLHIATHGFFLEDAPTPDSTRAVVSPSLLDSGPSHRPPDPLLRSGLVLAGARAPEAQPSTLRREDSLVTALELAGLNLWGTQMVVLSACDTGRGDVKLGQGVYGLRRALLVAGAETVVTSLWKVNDETTRELMEGYYLQLLAGQGRTTALRAAMKELRKKKPHPFYWAPFIAIGQDAPLRGLAPATEAQPTP